MKAHELFSQKNYSKAIGYFLITLFCVLAFISNLSSQIVTAPSGAPIDPVILQQVNDLFPTQADVDLSRQFPLNVNQEIEIPAFGFNTLINYDLGLNPNIANLGDDTLQLAIAQMGPKFLRYMGGLNSNAWYLYPSVIDLESDTIRDQYFIDENNFDAYFDTLDANFYATHDLYVYEESSFLRTESFVDIDALHLHDSAFVNNAFNQLFTQPDILFVGTSTWFSENGSMQTGQTVNRNIKNPVRHFIQLTEDHSIKPVYVLRMFDPLNFVAAFGNGPDWTANITMRTSPIMNLRMNNDTAQMDLCDSGVYNDIRDFILATGKQDIRRQVIKLAYEYFQYNSSLTSAEDSTFQSAINDTTQAGWNTFVGFVNTLDTDNFLDSLEIFLEFGNELYFDQFYKFLPPDPASIPGLGCNPVDINLLKSYYASELMYAELCRSGNVMIKQIFSNAKTGVITRNTPRNCDWMETLENNLTYLQDFDAWILHYYPKFFDWQNNGDTLLEYDSSNPLNPLNENLTATQLNDLVRIFDIDGHHNASAFDSIPVWVTEFGSDFCHDANASCLGPPTGSWFDMIVKLNMINQFFARPDGFQQDMLTSPIANAHLMYNTASSNNAEPLNIEMLLSHTLSSGGRGHIEIEIDSITGDVSYQFRDNGLIQIIFENFTRDNHNLISPVNFTVGGNTTIIEDDGITDGNYISSFVDSLFYCPTDTVNTIQAPLHYGWMSRSGDEADCLSYHYLLVNNSHEAIGIDNMHDVNLQNADLFLFDVDSFLIDLDSGIVSDIPLMNISNDIINQIQNEEVSVLINPDDYFCYYSGNLDSLLVDFSDTLIMPPYSIMLFEGDPGALSANDVAFFGLLEVDTYTVGQDFTWTGDRIATEEIVIDSGYTLTLDNCTLRFITDAGLTIMPGGELLIENSSVLTSQDCSGSWRGILALGDAENHTQTLDNQARIGMDGANNGSIIENAETGIQLGTMNGADGDGGAWLEAQDVTFRNNRVDIDMKAYRSFDDEDVEISNMTHFDNCLFLTDTEILNGPLEPYIHVDMIGLWGIDFINCSWINESGALFKDVGINAVCTTYDVFGENISYVPADEYGTAFHGLGTAILHLGYNYDFFRVAEMEFSDNYRAVYALAATGNEFSFNSVTLSNGNYRPSFPIGAWFINCDDLTFEENDIRAATPATHWGYGAILDNGAFQDDSYNDIVRKNSFSDLGVGTCVRNDNRTSSGGGLQSKCNFYSNNHVDIYLQEDAVWKTHQGSALVGQIPNDVEDLTNNSFSYAQSLCEFDNTDFVIDDYDGSFFYYIFDNSIAANEITDPDCPVDSGGVFRMDNDAFADENLVFVDSIHCPPGINPPMIVGGITDVQPWLDLFELENDAVHLLEITLNGGVGQELIDAINDVYGNSSAFVRDLLLQSYPLTDEVLREVIERAIPLDSWHLTQVLLANAPLRSDVTAFLEDSEVLSPFFMGFIFQANQSGNANLRTILEMEFAYRQQERWKVQQSLLRNIHALPDSVQAAEYALYLSEKGGDQATGALIWQAFEAGDMNSVQSLSSQLTDSSFTATLNLVLNSQDSLTTFQWDDLYQAYLAEGSNFGLALSHLNAHSDSIIWPEFDPIPSSYKSRRTKPASIAGHSPGILQIFPNPLDNEGYFTFDAEIGDEAEIRLYDLQGKLINVFKTNDVGMISFSTKNWPTGFYTAGLYFKDRLMDHIKFVKQ